MSEKNKADEKKEIIKELLLSEEESVAQLKAIITRAKSLVRIDGKTKKTVVAGQFDFTVPERIALLLIGRHFAKELGLHEQEGLTIKELEDESGIVKTTLSGQLGRLVRSGYVGQDNEKRYYVVRHRINDVIEALHAKYVDKTNSRGIPFKSESVSKRKKEKKNGR